MIFSEFVQKLSSVIQGSDSNGHFVYTLFGVLLPENKRCALEFKEDTFRRYYNGQSNITRIAKKVYADANRKSFEDFINDYGKDARIKLSEIFSDELTDINSYNAGKLLSELFLEIIKNAARKSNKTPQRAILTNEKVTSKSYHNNSDNTESNDNKNNNKGSINVNGRDIIIITDSPNSTINASINNNKPDNSAEKMIAIKHFSKEYYQLIVTSEDDVFENGIATIPTTMALTQSLVPPEILSRCSTLTNEGIEELKTFPAIVCKENTDLHGRTSPTQEAAYCYINSIKKVGKNIKIKFSPIEAFAQSKLSEKVFNLKMDCDLTDLNRTAWSVHKVNLFDAFDEADIQNMPKPL